MIEHKTDGEKNTQNRQGVLIIIPTLNEESVIEKTLDQILTSQLPEDSLIVVADGGSEDNTVEIVNSIVAYEPRLMLMHNPKKIQSAAINSAVKKYGQGRKWLVRVDAHGEYPENYIQKLLEDAEENNAQSVVVSMLTASTDGYQKWIAEAQNSPLGNGGSPHRKTVNEGKFVQHGHHALMDISLFEDVGGYDETFTHNEDAELDYRLIENGGKIWLTAKTSMIYYPRKTLKSLARQYFNYGKGRARFMGKHKILPQLRQFIMIGVMPAILLSAFVPITYYAAVPMLIWLGACLCVVIGGAILGKTKLPILVPALVMHASWSLGFWRSLMSIVFGKKDVAIKTGAYKQGD